MSLMKSYLMLQNARFAAFTVSKLLKENQQGRGKNTPTQIRVNDHFSKAFHSHELYGFFSDSYCIKIKTYLSISKTKIYTNFKNKFLLSSKKMNDIEDKNKDLRTNKGTGGKNLLSFLIM